MLPRAHRSGVPRRSAARRGRMGFDAADGGGESRLTKERQSIRDRV
jgi:hypothetical protein